MATINARMDRRLDEKSPPSSLHEHAMSVEEQGTVQEFDDVETARVLRKVDWRLLPVLSLLYLLAFLDRSNLGKSLKNKASGRGVVLR